MAMTHRGNRIQATIRLPYDEYREVVARARRRGWSMSDYIGWCVAKELSGVGKELTKSTKRHEANPLGMAPTDSFGLAQPHPLSGHGSGGPVDERFVDVRSVEA